MSWSTLSNTPYPSPDRRLFGLLGAKTLSAIRDLEASGSIDTDSCNGYLITIKYQRHYVIKCVVFVEVDNGDHEKQDTANKSQQQT